MDGFVVSLVGGVVRDALLGIPDNQDVDLVVEGDAIALAEHLGHVLSVRVIDHGRFGTAYLELPHERWIDLVTARRERYPTPGGLPVVEAGTLDDDLARRDFTINAMAWRLTGPDAMQLIDPLGGRADLDARAIRFLHPGSFVDDPTRILRAARYAARLGFTVEPATRAAAGDAATNVDPSSARTGDELRRLLRERADVAATAVGIARDLGVSWLREVTTAEFEAIDAALLLPQAPALDAWALRLGRAVRPEVIDQVAVDGWARGVAAEAARGPELRERVALLSRRSEVDALVALAKPATAVVACAHGAPVIAEWWSMMRDMRLAIGGEDLVSAGVRPGPPIGRALAGVRAARLDGEVGPGADEQLALALSVIEESS